MSGFSDEWLTLRAPWDAAARAPAVAAAALDWIVGQASDRPARILDLGCGNGNNQRHLAKRIAGPQHWTLVDSDPVLLDLAAGRTERGKADRIEVCLVDLATADLDRLVEGHDLVTASALFDLVSGEWLARLLGAVERAGAGLLAVLSYDGRIEWTVPDPLDPAVREAVNRHQRRDKGFGPALGPLAASALADWAARRGGVWRAETSDWQVAAEAPGAGVLIDGWAKAAEEELPERATEFALWAARRRAGAGVARVGHLDVFSAPSGALT